MKLNRECRSDAWFWIGVPVVTARKSARRARAARARLVAAFLIACASSSTALCQATAHSRSASRCSSV